VGTVLNPTLSPTEGERMGHPAPPPPPCKFLVFSDMQGSRSKFVQPRELEVKVLGNKELGGCFGRAERGLEGESATKRQQSGPVTGQSSHFQVDEGRVRLSTRRKTTLPCPNRGESRVNRMSGDRTQVTFECDNASHEVSSFESPRLAQKKGEAGAPGGCRYKCGIPWRSSKKLSVVSGQKGSSLAQLSSFEGRGKSRVKREISGRWRNEGNQNFLEWEG
jgi:hypothetical protein